MLLLQSIGHQSRWRSMKRLSCSAAVKVNRSSRPHTHVSAKGHVPVLVEEAIKYMTYSVPSNGTPEGRPRLFCDATFGRGGYTRRLLDSVDCTVIAIDRDPIAYRHAVDMSNEPAYRGRLIPVHAKFGDLISVVRQTVQSDGPCLDGLMMDIGVSSNQLDEAERGFSFRQDGPLDMRMGATGDNDMAPELSRTIPAEVIVNNFPEEEIADIIYQYGEERLSRKIAKAIVTARKTAPIRTTKQLASIIFGAVGSRTGAGADGFKHPAVRTFQALRIYVNDELNELRRALKAAEVLLLPSAPLTVTTFHSLEDRIVKEFLKRCSLPPKDLPYTDGMIARSSAALDESDLAMFPPGEQQNERENEKARLRAKREKRLSRASGGKPSIGNGFGEPSDTEELFRPSFEIVTKRTVKPTRQEVVENKRARSAKLRAALRTSNPPIFPLALPQ